MEEELNIENNPNEYDQLTKYVNDLTEAVNKEETKAIADKILNLLPSDVKSFSVPLLDKKEGVIFITSEREGTNISKEKQRYWGVTNLIEYLSEKEKLKK